MLFKDFVSCIILFILDGFSFVGLADGCDLGCCLIWRNDGAWAGVSRWNKIDGGQCVEHYGGNSEC